MAKKNTNTAPLAVKDNPVLQLDDNVKAYVGDGNALTFKVQSGYHPGDVDIEETNNDYIAYRKTSKGNELVSYPEHRNGERLDQWAKKLSDIQLEAAIQIYYDRWAFGSGEAIDKIYFDSLDVERTRRRCSKDIGSPTILPRRNDSDTGFGEGN